MVSIKDIAQACGVSAATVSKALNDHDDVGSATKQRVREAAKELGYLPNSMARALKTKKSYNVGVLMVDKANSGLTHHYFAAILDSFKVVMEQNGYDLTFISDRVGDNTCSYYEHCVYRNVDGVLAACVDFGSDGVKQLLQKDLPIVSIDHMEPGKYAVVSDNENGIRELLGHAFSLGHRKIAYIYGEEAQVTDTRLAAFYEFMQEQECRVYESFLRAGKYLDGDLAYRMTQELLRAEEKPTCILYPDDICAMAGMSAVRDEGLRVGKDVSIIGYDGTPLLRMLRPSLTTIMQDTEAMGRKAADMLLKLLRKEEIPPEERVKYCRGTFLGGETVETPDEPRNIIFHREI